MNPDVNPLASLEAVQQRLTSLWERTRTADVRRFDDLAEDGGWQSIVGRASLPIAQQIVDQARELVTLLQDPEAAAVLIERAELSRGDGVAGPAQEVADVAFVANMELRSRSERLRHLAPTTSSETLIGECEGALRGVVAALGAVDRALARASRRPPRLDPTAGLEESLRVRAAYGDLRRHLVAMDQDRGPAVDGRLRYAAGKLAALVHGPLGPRLRVRDRLQLATLYRRVARWLEAPSDTLAGERLWRDVVGASEILMAVNRRQELLQHDHELLGHLLRLLDADCADEVLRRAAERLAGLDLALDRSLARDPIDRAVVRERASSRHGGVS